MAKKTSNSDAMNDAMALIEAKKALENEMSRSFSGLYEGLKKEKKIRTDILSLEKEINNIQKIISDREYNGIKLSQEELKLLQNRKGTYQSMVNDSKNLVNNLDKQKILMSNIKNSSADLVKNSADYSFNMGKTIIGFMDQQDGLIKKLNLELGISNVLSKSYGLALLKSAEYTERLGVSAADLVTIQREYVNETGRLSNLNEQNFKDISLVAAGTGMAVDSASKLVGQFELFGLSINDSKGLIENVVNEANKYGISSGKLLGNISKNIDKVNQYSFRNGIKGLVEMSKYAERFKIDMGSTFNAMDKSRTLEGSLDMAAKLMVMGGKFSEADPFKLMFLSRNDPAKYQEALNKMTEGTAVFNKSTKEFEIGAYDLDRLRYVAEATGKDFNKLTEETKRFAAIKMAKNQIFSGTKEDKEMIATIAKMGKDGKYTVDVDGKTKDLTKLTQQDIALLKQQEKTLEQRAIDSQNFDATLKNLIMEFKSTFLPLLTVMNKALDGFKAIISGLRSIMPDGSLKWVAGIGLGAGLLLKAGYEIGKVFLMGKSIFGAAVAGPKIAQATMSSSGAMGSSIATGAGASPAGTTANYARAASIAAIGVAAVGIGYGIKLAADGFSNLGLTMQKLDLETKNRLLGAMAITFGGLATVILAAGFAGNSALAGLLGIAGVVASIGAAGAGIGYLVDKLNEFSNPELKLVQAIKGVDFNPMRNAFIEGNKFLKADLSNIDQLVNKFKDLKKLGLDESLNKLSNIFSKPLQMEFVKGQDVSLNIDVTNIIDGEKLVTKHTKKVMVEVSNSRRGRGSLSF